MEGLIFDIQKFCINDGPGIRTTVFLKGCPLDCLWCHNPESKSFQPQLSFDKKKCSHCGICQTVCTNNVHKVTPENHTIHFDKCQGCSACVNNCPTGALTLFGKKGATEQVMAIVVQDKDYYENSGGGLTISGGEPLSQFPFTYELAKAAKNEGIHVAIETSGFGNPEHFRKIANYVDLFLFDYKATGHTLHKQLTGVDRKTINTNLDLLTKLGANITLRCPLIPTYNIGSGAGHGAGHGDGSSVPGQVAKSGQGDGSSVPNNLTDAHFAGIVATVNRYPSITAVEILPYHNFGVGKEKQIGNETTINTYVPSDAEVAQWLDQLKTLGLKNVKRG